MSSKKLKYCWTRLPVWAVGRMRPAGSSSLGWHGRGAGWWRWGRPTRCGRVWHGKNTFQSQFYYFLYFMHIGVKDGVVYICQNRYILPRNVLPNSARRQARYLSKWKGHSKFSFPEIGRKPNWICLRRTRQNGGGRRLQILVPPALKSSAPPFGPLPRPHSRHHRLRRHQGREDCGGGWLRPIRPLSQSAVEGKAFHLQNVVAEWLHLQAPGEFPQIANNFTFL